MILRSNKGMVTAEEPPLVHYLIIFTIIIVEQLFLLMQAFCIRSFVLKQVTPLIPKLSYMWHVFPYAHV